MSYKTEGVAIKQAKQDRMNILLGAFYIVVYTDDRFDYYPLGTWPAGTAQTVSRYVQKDGKWKLIKLRTREGA